MNYKKRKILKLKQKYRRLKSSYFELVHEMSSTKDFLLTLQEEVNFLRKENDKLQKEKNDLNFILVECKRLVRGD